MLKTFRKGDRNDIVNTKAYNCYKIILQHPVAHHLLEYVTGSAILYSAHTLGAEVHPCEEE
jgi:hypothetical protein